MEIGKTNEVDKREIWVKRPGHGRAREEGKK